MPPEAPVHASALLRLWSDLALQHVSMGGACACGIGGVTLRLQDFERDIIDYLRAEAERLGQADACALLDRHAAAGDGAVAAVLGELAAAGAGVPADAAAWVLARLDRTLTSFARLHGPARDGRPGASS
ncbi:MAG: hypothetical protein QHC78_10965 [Pigmentiphaga sp.]|uniref:hypothetical protein n=1 Tax=Pigmentiphaga sp. TaxID=1977564 RepID=UPI0029AB5A44|nr:hypothetical protein [Pigmentiphaga sp.]MDX3906198.1 hypothetical protein [Pigmentiphaga sp.]